MRLVFMSEIFNNTGNKAKITLCIFNNKDIQLLVSEKFMSVYFKLPINFGSYCFAS